MAITGCALADRPPAPPVIHFMAKTYHLASFNQKDKPMWEFVSGTETANDWTTLFTITEQADAHAISDLNKLSDGLTSNYESHGGKVLLTKTMNDFNGEYRYLVAAFDEPSKQRMELRFVKVGISRKNGYVAAYGVRIADPGDYGSKAKAFLHNHSAAIGNALGQLSLPDVG